MRNSANMKRYLRKCALNVRNLSFLDTFRTFKAYFLCRRNTWDFLLPLPTFATEIKPE